MPEPFIEANSDGQRCGHNCAPLDCPYKGCGYREALQEVISLKSQLQAQARIESDRQAHPPPPTRDFAFELRLGGDSVSAIIAALRSVTFAVATGDTSCIAGFGRGSNYQFSLTEHPKEAAPHA